MAKTGFDLREWISKANENVGGFESLVESLIMLIHMGLNLASSHKNILLHGPVGTGKSFILKEIVNASEGVFWSIIHASEIVGSDEGGTERLLYDIFEKSWRKSPCILIIEDVDSLLGGALSTILLERRVSQEFHDLLVANSSRHGESTVVIGTTSRFHALPSSILSFRRFDKMIELKVPTPLQRIGILKKMMASFVVPESEDNEYYTKIAECIGPLAHGYVPTDLLHLIRETIFHVLKTNNQTVSAPTNFLPTSITLTPLDFENVMNTIRPATLKPFLTKVEKVKWEDIGGLDHIIEQLKTIVLTSIEKPEVLQRLGISPPRGILLYGSSGNGKTLLSMALAASSNINFISIQSTEVISKVVGESEKTLSLIFRTLRSSAPCILYLDQIEALAYKRGRDNSTELTQDRLLSCLLTEMDGIESSSSSSPVVVLGNTTRPDLLDPAILRSGRFDYHFHIPPPSVAARKDILKKKLALMPCENITEENIDQLANETEHFSGADLANLCREAAMYALRENISSKVVLWEHFLMAKKHAQPSLIGMPSYHSKDISKLT